MTWASSRGIQIASVERQVGFGEEETASVEKTHQELTMMVKVKDREVPGRGWDWE